jgi:hypothetical protein
MKDFASILGNFATAVSVFLAVVIFKCSDNAQRSAQANAAILEYQKLAIENPDLFKKAEEIDPVTFQWKPSNPADVKYALFATFALTTSEQILALQNDDKEWKSTVKDIVSVHTNFIRHKKFDLSMYSKELRDILNPIIKQSQN